MANLLSQSEILLENGASAEKKVAPTYREKIN